MRLTTLTLHGQRGDTDRVEILFGTTAQALQYLQEINDRRSVTGLGPARASLVSREHERVLL